MACALAGSLVALATWSCSRPPAPPVPPPLPSSFAAPPALGAPDTIDERTFGAAYLALLGQALQPRWADFLDDLRLRLAPDHALNDQRLRVVVDLGLSPAGVLVVAEVHQGSGQPDFDRAALEVVQDAQPFPAPSVELVSDDDLVRVRWSFARDRRQAGPATAQVQLVLWPLARTVPELIGVGKIDAALERIARSAEAPAERVAQLDVVAMAVIRAALERGLARTVAVRAVGRARLRELAPEVRLALNADAELRRAAAEAFALVGSDDEVLVELTRDDDPVVARTAALAVKARGRGPGVARDAARRLEHGAGAAALAVLAEIPSVEAAGALVALGTAGDRGLRLAAMAPLAALAELSSAPPAVARTLLRAVGDRDAGVRRAACRALDMAPRLGRSALRTALRGLGDLDARVRGACLVALARLDRRSFRRRLASVAAGDEAPLQLGIARALAEEGGADAVTRLSALGQAADPEVRRAAARSLAGRADDESQVALARLAGDGDAMVRRVAVGALTSAERLREALADRDEETRAVALERLAGLEGREGAIDAAVHLLSAAPPVPRVALAGAWLASRLAGR